MGYCGKEIDNQAVVCPHCGVAQQELAVANDTGGIGWGLLGCCIPVVGLILFLVWKDNKPRTAKAAGIGALISVGLSLLSWILTMGLGVGGAMMM